MKRVHIICEGQTEETFVNEVLAPHLHRIEVDPAASLVGKPGRKGGGITTERMGGDIERRLKGDREAWVTIFFDFYELETIRRECRRFDAWVRRLGKLKG